MVSVVFHFSVAVSSLSRSNCGCCSGCVTELVWINAPLEKLTPTDGISLTCEHKLWMFYIVPTLSIMPDLSSLRGVLCVRLHAFVSA